MKSKTDTNAANHAGGAPTLYLLFRAAKWPLIAISLLMSLRYLLWRGMYTLNHQGPLNLGLSVLLYAAEIFGFISSILFFIQACRLKPRVSVPMNEAEPPAVDVLITICNEPAEVLYRTLVACSALDYPKERLKVYICDDGNREEIRKLAGDFDFGYITRKDRAHAKAGNLNNAIKNTSGEFIFILDCDHIPVGSFLKETLGFFSGEPKLAFVQTPHHFYNPDCYQKDLRLEDELVNEQDLFSHVIQPGKDSSNSAIFTGSAAVFRRSALESVGGFRVEVAIEDLHTSMELHSRGWQSFFYNKILMGGLAPESYAGYLTQRNRWTQGGVQVFMRDNPLFKGGLSLLQRLSYLGSILYFFNPIPRLIYLALPLALLLFSRAPIIASLPMLLWYFLPHYIFALAAFHAVGKEFRSPFWSDVYDTSLSFFLSLTVFKTLLRPDKLVFNVTPKGNGVAPKTEVLHWSFIMPHILVMALLTFGLIRGAYGISAGTIGIQAYEVTALWSIFNLLLLATSIEVARERPQQRGAYRLRRSIPCVLKYDGSEISAETMDISETGLMASIRTTCCDVPETVTLNFKGSVDDTEDYKCKVMWTSWAGGTGKVGLGFVELDEHKRRNIIRNIFSAPASWSKAAWPHITAFAALQQIVRSSSGPRRAPASPVKQVERYSYHIPCIIAHHDKMIDARLENVSSSGAALRFPRGIDLPRKMHLILPLNTGPDQDVEAGFVREISKDGDYMTIGVKFLSPAEIDPEILNKKASP